MAEQTKEDIFTYERFYIDKSAPLVQALAEYPCVYLEGAAASGKTTAIRMAIQRQDSVSVLNVSAEGEGLEVYSRKIDGFRNSGRKHRWIVVEDFPAAPDEEETGWFLRLIGQLGPGERLILEGREELPAAFFDLLWKGQLQLLTQETLTLTREETARLAAERNSFLNPSELHEKTGGWAGGVDLLLRLTVRPPVRMGTAPSVEEILRRREVQDYLEQEVFQTLRQEEKELLDWTELCPWLHPELCGEVFGIPQAAQVLERLWRKGILTLCSKKHLWKRLPLFQTPKAERPKLSGCGQTAGKKAPRSLSGKHRTPIENARLLRQAGAWFDRNGMIGQALYCLEQAGDENGFMECLQRHCMEIPFSGILWTDGLWPEDASCESCYLRGMEAVVHQDWIALQEEIRLLKKQKDAIETQNGPSKRAAELLVNLTFADPSVSLEDWLKQLKQTAKVHGPLHLGHILGGSCTFLCGLRDLSALFVGGRKAERKKAELWKNSLGAEEWKAYQFARVEFYLETKQLEKLPEEDRKLLLTPDADENWTFLFARYWLLIKLRRSGDGEPLLSKDGEEAETAVRTMLEDEENPICRRILEAADALRTSGGGEKILFSWLREKKNEWSDEISEETVGMWYLRCAACYEIHQLDRTEKILKKLLPFARSGRRSRILAECLFQQAAISWSRENRKKSLQEAVESFLVTGEYRYVKFYTQYGRNGYGVIGEYMEWLSSSSPDSWSRKKKYNYGNVLNMPVEDYMNVILREAKKTRGQAARRTPEETEESLTVTEIIVLKELSTGRTNEEICTDLNLKLTTVKGHIYSIYKKLGVKSRVQALLIGRERGLLKE